MTDDSLRLAGEVNILQLHDEFPTLVYSPPPLSTSGLPDSLSLLPWGNMAFEVNTICFVAFL